MSKITKSVGAARLFVDGQPVGNVKFSGLSVSDSGVSETDYQVRPLPIVTLQVEIPKEAFDNVPESFWQTVQPPEPGLTREEWEYLLWLDENAEERRKAFEYGDFVDRVGNTPICDLDDSDLEWLFALSLLKPGDLHWPSMKNN